jgi:hypothetical protein
MPLTRHFGELNIIGYIGRVANDIESIVETAFWRPRRQ